MSPRIDGLTGRVNGCRNETVYADLHFLVILVQAATRCCKRPAKAERTLRNTTIHSTVTVRDEKRADELAGGSGRRRGGNEVKEAVQSEREKDQTEKETGDDNSCFHVKIV